ncbi:glycoside hydrolase family 108 protein [Superficieibacter sp.]|uniref:glycoside hydrolase family 108 protein n=1 Tax=Superficieibacter sp. TaxID=2303322 RepID=UPI0028AA1349|nr:glycoside hydrolase family 108 protein [Superficieibacter sp.]
MNPVIDGILMTEGGYTNNPKDLGGETNWGITEATARAQGYTGEMRDMTRMEAYDILEKNYWLKPGFDRISELSWPIAFELCDAAVNIGPRLPCTWLQRWLNVLNREQKNYCDIVVDGKIGAKTIAALEAYLNWRGNEGMHVLVEALNCSQGAYYLNITEDRSQNEEFVYGWIKNRVA